MAELSHPSTATPQPANAPRKKEAGNNWQFMHHSQFGKQDRGDVQLSLHVKQLIISGPKRVYEPEKIQTRTESCLIVADSAKLAALDLERRKREVLLCGFCSDPREPYKTLGELYLESDALLFHSLQLPTTGQKYG
jgi:hypothetical protein